MTAPAGFRLTSSGLNALDPTSSPSPPAALVSPPAARPSARPRQSTPPPPAGLTPADRPETAAAQLESMARALFPTSPAAAADPAGGGGLQSPLPGQPLSPADRRDGLLGLALLLLGWFALDLIFPRTVHDGSAPSTASGTATALSNLAAPGLGFPLFILLAGTISLAYLTSRQCWPAWRTPAGWRARIGGALVVAGALPLAIFAWTPWFAVVMVLDLAGFVVWTAYAAGWSVARRFDADFLVDVANQLITVPLTHLTALPAGLSWLLRGHRRARQLLAGLLGLIIGLPVIVLVVALLMQSDDRFNTWLQNLGHALEDINPLRWFLHGLLCLLVAFPGCAVLSAAGHHSPTGRLLPDQADRLRRRLQRLPQSLLASPLALLCLCYITFFAALGSYLFSALLGRLPSDFTYAEYARRGFFELTGVAAINLAVLAGTRLFARRATGEKPPATATPPPTTTAAAHSAHDSPATADRLIVAPNLSAATTTPASAYPPALRILGGLLSGLTCLLVVTALSKMLLYINAYGLTRQRLATGVVMVTLLVIFGWLTGWHARPFALSRPILLTVLIALLGSAWLNPDGLIARYNVDRYLSGDVSQLDTAYLASLSDAVVPALERLRQAPGHAAEAQQALDQHQIYGLDRTLVDDRPWTSWTWQSSQAEATVG